MFFNIGKKLFLNVIVHFSILEILSINIKNSFLNITKKDAFLILEN